MTQAGTVYAQALYELARDKGLDESILSEMNALEESFDQNPEYIRLLRSASLPKEERCQVLDQGFPCKLPMKIFMLLEM